jgi:hypothetical protein
MHLPHSGHTGQRVDGAGPAFADGGGTDKQVPEIKGLRGSLASRRKARHSNRDGIGRCFIDQPKILS